MPGCRTTLAGNALGRHLDALKGAPDERACAPNAESARPPPGERQGCARMSQLDLARLQFAMTSIYHFLFVPLTIGLAFLTAILQTKWHRSGNAEQLRLT